jgi:pyruvate dehydrogenase E2 component (dihydrolipoamide acetyltransferase)
MIQSKHNAAHMSVFEEVEVTELIRLRDKYKDKFSADGVSLSYLPFILKALTKSLKKFRVLNSELDLENNRMIYKKYYNIGIAVDTEAGLVVPVIRNVDKLSIFELAQKLNEISEKARDRKLTLDDMKDGTFTITSYGSIGGLFAVPVINYPQAGILGIGRIHKKPIVKNDNIEIGNILPLSLSVDHRIVDGGEVARFINQIMSYLEDPASMIME